jgi:hypothetical protein
MAFPPIPPVPSIPPVPALPTGQSASQLNANPKVTKIFKRPDYPGLPKVEGIMHKSMEQGRMLESSLGDAIFILQDTKREVFARITQYTQMVLGGINCYIPDEWRPAPLSGTVGGWVDKAREALAEIVEIISALRQCIGWLQSTINNVRAYAQNLLNMIATLLHEICNLALPDLPALPNIFGLFHFDGFAFSALKFDFKLSFDTDFAFKQCYIHNPDLDIFRNYPKKIDLGGGLVLTMPDVKRPKKGSRAAVTDTQKLINNEEISPEFKNALASTSVPLFTPDYDIDRDVYGSFPDPGQIMSNYELAREEYDRNILSLVPAPSYTWGHGSEVPEPTARLLSSMTTARTTEQLNAKNTKVDNLREKIDFIRKDVRTFTAATVSLECIVDSGYNLHVVTAWLQYIHRCRYASPAQEQGRGGKWLPHFQEIYDLYIQPSYDVVVSASPIPWHTGVDGVLSAGPVVTIPLVETLTQWELNGDHRWGQLLWCLSYIEASLLKYNRSVRWDQYAAAQGTALDSTTRTYLSWITKADLDFVETLVDDTKTVEITLDSDGKAVWPSKINVPASLAGVMKTLIAKCERDVEQVVGEKATVFTDAEVENKYRFTYNIFAESEVVDKYTAYWRQFAANWKKFVDATRTDVRSRAVTQSYQDALDSFLNPLSTRLGIDYIYAWIHEDVLNQYTLWIPGTPTLPIPDALESATSQAYALIDGPGLNDPTGWSHDPNDYAAFLPKDPTDPTQTQARTWTDPAKPWTYTDPYAETDPSNPPPTPDPTNPPIQLLFSPSQFLARPDIQALPLNVQLKMLQLNEAAASVATMLAESEHVLVSKYNAVSADLDQAIAEWEQIDAAIDDAVHRSNEYIGQPVLVSARAIKAEVDALEPGAVALSNRLNSLPSISYETFEQEVAAIHASIDALQPRADAVIDGILGVIYSRQMYIRASEDTAELSSIKAAAETIAGRITAINTAMDDALASGGDGGGH